MVSADSSQWPPPLSEATAARDGDQAALASILTKGLPRLVAFYRGQGLDLADAEDVASDVCESLVRSIGRLRSPQAFEAWFWRVARSKFHDYLRRRHRPLPAPELETSHVLPRSTLWTKKSSEQCGSPSHGSVRGIGNCSGCARWKVSPMRR